MIASIAASTAPAIIPRNSQPHAAGSQPNAPEAVFQARGAKRPDPMIGVTLNRVARFQGAKLDRAWISHVPPRLTTTYTAG
jgi:hypothetical protein